MGLPSMSQGSECNFIIEPWLSTAPCSAGRAAAEGEPTDALWAVWERLAQPVPLTLIRKREAERKNRAELAVARPGCRSQVRFTQVGVHLLFKCIRSPVGQVK